MYFEKSGLKYKNVKVEIDGIKFDSKAEGNFYLYLKGQKIKIIELQPKVYLTEARILYKPDFLIEENGKPIYVDYKGFQTAVFKIKIRLWAKYGPGELRLIKGNKTLKTILGIYDLP